MVSDLQKIIEIAKKYVEVRVELLKLDIKEQSGEYLMKGTFLFGVVLIFLLILFFISLGLAFYLNEITNSRYYGFFILAAFFFIVMILLFLTRKSKRLQLVFHRIIDFFIFDKNE
ncbi:phage holin family protein [Hyphobacterium sp. CCMP332]|nr:phage holin family protein [Hyphobacterium sp. CCMP332]